MLVESDQLTKRYGAFTALDDLSLSLDRGQILGFEPREGWPGWDLIRGQLPESEMEDLIVELRSATAGVGSYTASFDHLSEITGKLAEQVLASHKAAAQ